MQRSETSGRPSALTPPRALWVGFILGLLIVGAIGLRVWSRSSGLFGARTGGSLAIYGTVPPFSLTERSGRPVTQADLERKIWVADFVFTRCGSICPALSANMARLQTALRERGGETPTLVSFTVDPAADTPPVLTDYASRFHADPQQWLFLTGERAALYDLIGEGFHLGVAQREESGVTDPNQLITHSDRFVLVDRALRIRGYYHGLEAATVAEILRDIDRLRSEQ